MIKKLMPKNLLNVFLCIFMAFSNIACSKESMKTSVSLTAYNHTESGVGSYIVTLADGTSVEAGYLAPGEGGGGETCCLSIPSVWKPGMKATISMQILKNGKPIRVEKTVSVPRYNSSDAGRFVVHFLHDGSLKVFVTKYSLGHRKYPLSGKEAELEPGVPLEIIWE
ncbi:MULTISPECIES: DUF3304 domain-containing protein [Janthinobacterium]|uniref:DUF3304 domain-containing protein n=1 Tax=Janthinobacterium TaxID=29580 RepID=UPI0009BD4D34|nr:MULTISPECIES: DUF3304 domain-containing protein [Janthinobacterium]MCC7712976.1 DUF3304 domain-containing protein [Janthinobacterium lividum]WQE31413.1 DUF3304 domain-containing protein [Janthinobacterium lividum]